MKDQAKRYVRKLVAKYLLLRVTETLLWSLAVFSVTYTALRWASISESWTLILSAASAIIVFFTCAHLLNLFVLDETRIIKFINHRYPQMEDSTDLLLKDPSSLSLLQQVQQSKIADIFRSLYPLIALPHNLWRASAISAISVVLLIILPAGQRISSTPSTLSSTPDINNKVRNVPASVKSIQVLVIPPPYTMQVSYSSELDIQAPEGSLIQWSISFSDTVRQATIILSGRDSIKLRREQGRFMLKRSCSSGFYQIVWKDRLGEIKTSDYYKIEMIEDQPPSVVINNLTQFTTLSVHDNLTVPLTSTISDDYRLTDGYIIATVSKGSGESVKFREEKLSFTSPATIRGKSVHASRSIDLLKLGLEPGDELYFYVEAQDNKTPSANRARTETFFIALRDTASDDLSAEAGLGVDLMPEYFRSQRQIIIDTEKLIKARSTIIKQAFNFKSNELGYDQKVLRLKYGEFLGEEFETAIGPLEPEAEEAEHTDENELEDPTKKYGHVHDKDNQHNLVPEKKTAITRHEHGAEEDLEKKENPMDAYKHDHDNAEVATFFNQSIRSKLKAALTIMWSAELHLRLYEPEKSLPFQYQALKLLKEVSNDARIYVHKTGFDPPPLKEEKRLSGDLTEIKGSFERKNLAGQEKFPGIAAALKKVDLLLQTSNELNAADKRILIQGGQELSALALKYPGKYLESLSLIKALNENEIKSTNVRAALLKIRRSLWDALPDKAMLPEPGQQSLHHLEKQFIQNLETIYK